MTIINPMHTIQASIHTCKYKHLTFICTYELLDNCFFAHVHLIADFYSSTFHMTYNNYNNSNI